MGEVAKSSLIFWDVMCVIVVLSDRNHARGIVRSVLGNCSFWHSEKDHAYQGLKILYEALANLAPAWMMDHRQLSFDRPDQSIEIFLDS